MPTPQESAASEESAYESVGRSADDSEYEIALELDPQPRCVTVGEWMSVLIRTEPKAELTLVVAYSDHQPHGQMGFAEANAEGVYRWRWVVGPDVPLGPATVLAQAWSPDGRRGGHEMDEFIVAELGGC